MHTRFDDALCGVLISLALLPGLGGSSEKSGGRSIPCKTAAIAARCYWTRGRLGFYNGTPAFRLWKIGTHRVLGIYTGPPLDKYGLDNEDPEFPAVVRRMFPPMGSTLVGDFEVCPLEPERPRTMQAACIEGAKNLRVVR